MNEKPLDKKEKSFDKLDIIIALMVIEITFQACQLWQAIPK
jgi:hypothetical protein